MKLSLIIFLIVVMILITLITIYFINYKNKCDYSNYDVKPKYNEEDSKDKKII